MDLGCCSTKFLKLDFQEESCQYLCYLWCGLDPYWDALGKCIGHLHHAWLHFSDSRTCRLDVVDQELKWTLHHTQKWFSLKHVIVLNFLPDSETLLIGTDANIYSYNFRTQSFQEICVTYARVLRMDLPFFFLSHEHILILAVICIEVSTDIDHQELNFVLWIDIT